ncbi:GNAT family N-acetyltransferase [Maribacter sp. 2307ULW6-5]|uniref:GNAT family N-acetyltransferase n=1 Tax=Maribacter sp. 2307ULW6-5 TaxID=3386275 RepID=UPI0039BC7803
MIVPAEKKDITALLHIAQACRKHMEAQHIYQWTPRYPARHHFENDLADKGLFCLKDNERIIGCVALSTKMDKVYGTVQWRTPTSRHLYVHRLAVHPHFQGQGNARKLMDFAENKARMDQAVSVRLDTFGGNKRNQRFYELRGYQKLGKVYFPQQSAQPFHCYELILAPSL